MKISIIGAGNVGGLSAMRIVQEGLGDVVLVDIAKGYAEGKVFDLEDARPILKYNYNLLGTDNMEEIKGSGIIVITAGSARKPGMTREDLLNKNVAVVKDIAVKIKNLSPDAIVIMVTNPLDLITYFALKFTGFSPARVFGMGISLDTARFANLVAKELKISVTDIDASVIGPHGEGMLPLPRFTNIKGVPLDEFIDAEKVGSLVERTVGRGKEIVLRLGSGSAYFAPSAAIAAVVRAVVKDEKRVFGVSAYLNGEYGASDVCIGVPCRLGKEGIERIIELDLNEKEKEAFNKSVNYLKEQKNAI